MGHRPDLSRKLHRHLGRFDSGDLAMTPAAPGRVLESVHQMFCRLISTIAMWTSSAVSTSDAVQCSAVQLLG